MRLVPLELRMVKSRAEMMELVGRFLADMAAFRRGRNRRSNAPPS
jgi:hypothetical protein